MKILYQAFDGKMFEDEDECEKYENDLRYGRAIDEDLIAGLDSHGFLLEIDDNFIEYVDMVRLSNQEAVDIFNEMCERADLSMRAEEPGVFHWPSDENNVDNRLKKVDEIIQEHIDIIEELERRKKIIQ